MKSDECKCLLTVISASIAFLCVAADPDACVSETELSGFFESIERKGTNIVFTTHKDGMRFLYRIGDSKWKLCERNESIIVPCNSTLTASEHHLSLTVSPLPGEGNRNRFRLSLKKDFRSMRGNLATNYAYMVCLDEKPDSSGGEKGSAAPEGNRAMPKSAGVPEKGAEKKCLKGLTLLPCED